MTDSSRTREHLEPHAPGTGDYSECVQSFASKVLAAHFNPEANEPQREEQ